MENYEKEIQFRLVKAKGPLVKGDKYHARIVDNGPIDAIAEICEQDGTFTRSTLQYYVGSVFERMLRGVATDGQSRRSIPARSSRRSSGGRLPKTCRSGRAGGSTT